MMRLLGLGIAAVALLAPVPASAQGEAAFPDGEWQGVMVYSASIDFGSGGTGATTGQGNFSLTVAGGQVTAGGMSFSANAEISIPGGSGSVSMTGAMGGASGPAGAPLVTVGDLTLAGTVTLTETGISVPIDTTVPGSDTSGLVLAIDAVGCDRISGDMTQEVTEILEGAGVGVPSLNFRWSAVRAGADPAATDALRTAVDAADKLVIDAARGRLDPAALGNLLAQADGISAGLPSSGDCPTETFSTPLSGAIVDLLTALTANPDATAGQLWAAVNAGVRTGVLAAGSPLAASASTALASQLGDATPGQAYTVYLAARALGDDDLAADALDAAGA